MDGDGLVADGVKEMPSFRLVTKCIWFPVQGSEWMDGGAHGIDFIVTGYSVLLAR